MFNQTIKQVGGKTQVQHGYYDDLMLNCLKVEGYDKTRAIRLFLLEIGGGELWKRGYAYKVYERVIAGAGGAPELKNELVHSIRQSLIDTRQQALMTGNWTNYNQLVDRASKVAGFDKPQVEVNNHTQIMNVNPEELKQRIEQRARRIQGIAGLVDGAGRGPDAGGNATAG